MIKSFRWLLPSLLALLLIGCGFHLRGTQSAKIDLTAVSFDFSARDLTLENDLKQSAVNHNITATPNADWRIHITHITTEKRRVTSSVTAERDRFSLNYRVTYYLIKEHTDHQDTFGPISIERQTVFQDNEKYVVSKHSEEVRLFDELRVKTADALLRRAALIASNPPNCKAHHENKGTRTQ